MSRPRPSLYRPGRESRPLARWSVRECASSSELTQDEFDRLMADTCSPDEAARRIEWARRARAEMMRPGMTENERRARIEAAEEQVRRDWASVFTRLTDSEAAGLLAEGRDLQDKLAPRIAKMTLVTSDDLKVRSR